MLFMFFLQSLFVVFHICAKSVFHDHSLARSLIYDHVLNVSRTPQKHDIEQLIHSFTCIQSSYSVSTLQFCSGSCFEPRTGRRLHTLDSHCYERNWSQQITFYILVHPLLHVDSHLFGIISVFTIVTKETILAIVLRA